LLKELDRRCFLKVVGIGTAAITLTGCSNIADMCFADNPDAKASKPNIIFIVTDDMGPWGYGASGNSQAHTPNIDKLRRCGARLTNCYSPTAVCSPARASILTSRYGTEVGITDYIKGGSSKVGLDQKFTAWPRLLSDAGYETALFGKWHLGDEDKHHPTKFGYQEFKGFRHGAGISKDPEVEIDGVQRQVKGYTPDILTDFALDFIERKKDKPFAVSLHFWAPHANTRNKTPDGDRTWLPLSDADWEHFKDIDPKVPNPDYPDLDIPRVKRMMREYLASIAGVDRNLGRVMKLLDGLDLEENTIVIFTSDHGYNMGHNGIWHKGNGRWILTTRRDSRPNQYEKSLKVPAVIRWPKAIHKGMTIHQTITHLDWFPTILAMAGIEMPKNVTIRGRNFLSILKGKKIEWDNDLYAQYTMRGAGAMRAWRSGRWKLVRDFDNFIKDEFYDLLNDPDEHNNLIDSDDPVIRRQIEIVNKKLLTKMRQIDDPALSLNKDFVN